MAAVGRLESAVQLFTAALASSTQAPGSAAEAAVARADISGQLGGALAELGKPDDAIQHLKDAVAVDRPRPKATAAPAASGGSTRAFSEVFESGLAEGDGGGSGGGGPHPNARLWKVLGMAQQAAGPAHHQESIASFRRGLELGADRDTFASSHEYLAFLLSRAGDLRLRRSASCPPGTQTQDTSSHKTTRVVCLV